MKDAVKDPAASSSTRNQLKRFYRLWCLKESTVKALGVGIDCNLKSFEFLIKDVEETVQVMSTLLVFSFFFL